MLFDIFWKFSSLKKCEIFDFSNEKSTPPPCSRDPPPNAKSCINYCFAFLSSLLRAQENRNVFNFSLFSNFHYRRHTLMSNNLTINEQQSANRSINVEISGGENAADRKGAACFRRSGSVRSGANPGRLSDFAHHRPSVPSSWRVILLHFSFFAWNLFSSIIMLYPL